MRVIQNENSDVYRDTERERQRQRQSEEKSLRKIIVEKKERKDR